MIYPYLSIQRDEIYNDDDDDDECHLHAKKTSPPLIRPYEIVA